MAYPPHAHAQHEKETKKTTKERRRSGPRKSSTSVCRSWSSSRSGCTPSKVKQVVSFLRD